MAPHRLGLIEPLRKVCSFASQPIAQIGHAFLLSAVVAAIIGAILFKAVSDDARSAMLARRRQGMNCALETIERVRFAVHHNLKSLVIVIAASFACRHFSSFTPHGVCEFEQALANLERSTAGGGEICSCNSYSAPAFSRISRFKRLSASRFHYLYARVAFLCACGHTRPRVQRAPDIPCARC
jgi:hypothetical protein